MKFNYGNVNIEVIIVLKKIPVVIFLVFLIMSSTLVHAAGFKYVEIFDPKQAKVVKVVQLNREINAMVSTWIKDIDAIYGKNNPVTEDGYAIKVPLDPAVKIQGKWLNTLVNEVYIILPKNDPPFFMIFENKDKLSCFPFKGDIKTLSRILDFNLKAK